MNRSHILPFAVLAALVAAPATALADGGSPKKLNVVYWTGGTAHDYDAMTKIFVPALAKRLDTDIKVCRDAKFLDSPQAKDLDVIVMNHCYAKAKDTLTDKQQQALLDVVRGGVGVVAVHASYFSFVKWEEVHKFYGAVFTTHGSAKAVVVVSTVDKKHPIMKDLDASFEVVSELYESTPLAKDCHVLAEAWDKDKRKAHPSVWTRMYGKGRVVTILPGHWPKNYGVPAFQKLIARSAQWAAHRLGPSGWCAEAAKPKSK